MFMMPDHLFDLPLLTDGTLRRASMAQYLQVGLANSLLRQLDRIRIVNYISTQKLLMETPFRK
jgi:hypothetical protein